MKAKKERKPRVPRHPYDIGTHFRSPLDYESPRGEIKTGAEIVVLQADHVNAIYTIMDCLTGLVIRNVKLPAIPVLEPAYAT